MAGTMLRAIQLIIHPLLVLTADQTSNFLSGTDRFGPVSAHNLDEHASTSAAYRKRLVDYLLAIPADTTQTIYVFVSPHFLATHGDVRRALLRCARFGTLRSIVLDESHLSAKQAASFRPELRMIGATFLQPLYQSTSPNKRPFLVCTTATNSTNDHSRLERLTRTSFPPNYCCWSPKSDFAQRSIKMRMKVGSAYSKNTSFVISHLTTSLSAAFVFLNTRSLIDGIVKSLEAKIDKHEAVEADIIQIHGNMKKQLKFVNINIFTGKMTIPNVFPRVLISTSAGDMGVDHPDAQLVLNFEFPDDPSTAVQRRGRASRGGQDALFVIDAGISSYLSLVRRIGKSVSPAATDDDTLAGFNNSEIASPKKTQAATVKDNLDVKYALSKRALEKLKHEQSEDFLSVLSCFCLKLGCQHARLEHFCATGVMAADTSGDDCGDKCPICSGDYDELFLPISKEGVISFLQRSDGLRGGATVDGLLALVWKNDYWTPRIFDQKQYLLSKYHIEAMFLQLIAARFISAHCVDNELHWVVERDNTGEEYPPYRYTRDSSWIGVNLLPKTHKRRVPLQVNDS